VHSPGDTAVSKRSMSHGAFPASSPCDPNQPRRYPRAAGAFFPKFLALKASGRSEFPLAGDPVHYETRSPSPCFTGVRPQKIRWNENGLRS
jgi:hypothetical protein